MKETRYIHHLPEVDKLTFLQLFFKLTQIQRETIIYTHEPRTIHEIITYLRSLDYNTSTFHANFVRLKELGYIVPVHLNLKYAPVGTQNIPSKLKRKGKQGEF